MFSQDSPRVPHYEISVGGAPFEAKYSLSAVTVYEDVGAAGMFTLRLYNWDADKLKVKWVDDDHFAEGREVKIQMGYLDSLETLIEGEITGLEPEFCTGEPFSLTVRGYDRRHRLLRGRKTRSFVKMKDSDIARKVARGVSLRAKVKDSKVKLDYVLQHNQTDMEFLQERARRIGYEVVVEDKTLHFRPHQIATSAALTLSLDEDIIEFYPRSTTLTQVGQVMVRGWDPKEKKAIVALAGVGKETSKMGGSISGPQAAKKAFGQATNASVNWPMFNRAEANQSALGWFNDMALAYVSGEGVCVGRADLRAGAVVEIEGLGKRFSGRYYVVSTRHRFSPKHGYHTAFVVRRNAT